MAALCGCLVASFIPSAALPADMPNLQGFFSPEGPTPSFSWAGSYAGVQVGGGQMAGEIKATSKKTFDDGGFAGGIYAGHNWEVSRFVLGIEGDLTYLGNKKKFDHASLGKMTAKNNWRAELKGRVGLPIDRFMPYLSGGLAVSDYTLSSATTKKDETNLSLSVGAGVEYALSDQLRLRADYSLSGLDHTKHNFGSTRVKSEAASHILMLGVSYAF